MFQEETKIQILAMCAIVILSGGDVRAYSYSYNDMVKPISATATNVPLEINDPCTLEDVICENETVEGRIRIAARAAGIDEDTAVRIAKCESSLNPSARNPDSTAKGLYEFVDATWQWIEAEGSPLNETDAIREFMKWYPRFPNWWECK